MKERKSLVRAASVATVLCVGGAASAAMITIESVSGDGGGSPIATSIHAGQSFTTPAFTEPGQVGWELTSWTWLDASLADSGAGSVLVFDAGTDPTDFSPSTMSSATPGFLAESQVYASDEYTFATQLLLDESTAYIVLNDSPVTHSRFNTGDFGDGNRFSSGTSGAATWAASGNGDSNFRAELVSVVPEPASVALVAAGGLMMMKRSRRTTA